MYRTGDPRFRRRLDELGQTLENANIQAQSGLYDFQQHYIKPCFESITSCFTTCIDASCPSLNLTSNQRERLRRQQRQGRSRGRAELNFDFYDDWDEDENDALMGWSANDEFDRLLAGSGGYGTVSHNTQPPRPKGMTYPKARRKSVVDGGVQDPTVIPASSLFGKLFGGKLLRYKPSAADLQDNPGAARVTEQDITEGEALLNEGGRKKHRRARSTTITSGHTTDSLSSRGDIFPSDEEDDAVPLDDEFAMVLERRTTHSGPETDTSSGRTRSIPERQLDRRPSLQGSRHSTVSSRRRANSGSAPQSPSEERAPEPMTVSEMKEQEESVEREEEAEVERKREAAQKLAVEHGLATGNLPSKEDALPEEAVALTTPLPITLDEAGDDDTSPHDEDRNDATL